MLTKRYMPTLKNIGAIFEKIIEGTAPETFNQEHLKGLGFKSSNDRAIIPLLKDLGFLTSEGKPTDRYHAYRDRSQSKLVMAEALREAYEDIFHISERPVDKDKKAVKGKFKTAHNVSDRVADQQAATFYALLGLADLSRSQQVKSPSAATVKAMNEPPKKATKQESSMNLGLRYNIEIHLPATKDTEVYNAIFKSLRANLID